MDAESKVPTKGELKNTDDRVTKHRFYKSKKFWSITIVIALILLMLGTGIWYWRRVTYTHRMISESWHALILQSNKTTTLTDKVVDSESLNDASKQLHELDNEIKDKQYLAGQVPTWLNDKKSLEEFKKFLASFEVYTALAAKDSDDITALKDEDLDKLITASATVKKAAEDTQKTFAFLSESFPPEIFALKDDLERYKKSQDELKAQEDAAKSKQAQAAQKEANDKAEVEANVGKFMDGFIAADAAKMRRYMTDAYAKEYNFGNLSDQSRQYNYPASYRIIDIKKDGNNYVVKINVLYKPKDNNGGQYTSGVEYTLAYDNSSDRWLINNEKQGGGY